MSDHAYIPAAPMTIAFVLADHYEEPHPRLVLGWRLPADRHIPEPVLLGFPLMKGERIESVVIGGKSRLWDVVTGAEFRDLDEHGLLGDE